MTALDGAAAFNSGAGMASSDQSKSPLVYKTPCSKESLGEHFKVFLALDDKGGRFEAVHNPDGSYALNVHFSDLKLLQPFTMMVECPHRHIAYLVNVLHEEVAQAYKDDLLTFAQRSDAGSANAYVSKNKQGKYQVSIGFKTEAALNRFKSFWENNPHEALNLDM